MSAVQVPEGNVDAGAIWHYGDPFGEQRTALTEAVVVDRSPRAVLSVTGPDRRSWLHTISTQHVADMSGGDVRENLNLDGQGRVQDHWVQTDVGDTVWLDTESWRTEPLYEFLRSMVFWSKVQVADQGEVRILSLLGPAARQVAATLGAEFGIDASVPVRHAAALDGGFVRAMPWPLAQSSLDLAIPAERLASTFDALVQAGARPAGLWTFEALRAAALVPRLGVDTDARTIPHEVGWIAGDDDPRAVHLNKGCYRGQETVARVHNLGKPPRALVLLHLDGSVERPAPGDPVTAAGRTVGRVGTVIDHVDLGPIALAQVKRSVVEALANGNPAALDAGPSPAVIDTDLLPDMQVEQRGRAAVDRLRQRGDHG